MSDSNFRLTVFQKCHYILSHSFKKKKKKNKRHNGHTDITDWEIVQDRYKKKSERVRSDRKISVRVVWWKSRRTWRQSEVLWFFWVILKIQRKSIPCCPIISCLALSSIRLHREEAGRRTLMCHLLISYQIHTLFSHHALGSLNWRS